MDLLTLIWTLTKRLGRRPNRCSLMDAVTTLKSRAAADTPESYRAMVVSASAAYRAGQAIAAIFAIYNAGMVASSTTSRSRALAVVWKNAGVIVPRDSLAFSVSSNAQMSSPSLIDFRCVLSLTFEAWRFQKVIPNPLASCDLGIVGVAALVFA